MIYPRVLSIQMVTGRRVEVKSLLPSALHGLPIEETHETADEATMTRSPVRSESHDDGSSGKESFGEDWLVADGDEEEKPHADEYAPAVSTRCSTCAGP